jgi:predicted transcriptional regulator
MIDIKSEAIAIIDMMPFDSTIDDIMEELYFKAQVDNGLEQLDEGNFISHAEVKQRISKWIIK